MVSIIWYIVQYIQELVQGSADRLTKLSAKWEEVRGPLVERYRVLRRESEGRESEDTRLLGEVGRLRSRMKEVADETRQKESLYKQLVSVQRRGRETACH